MPTLPVLALMMILPLLLMGSASILVCCFYCNPLPAMGGARPCPCPAASPKIRTICSSENRFFMGPPSGYPKPDSHPKLGDTPGFCLNPLYTRLSYSAFYRGTGQSCIFLCNTRPWIRFGIQFSTVFMA